MTYAILLLTALAVLTMSVWGSADIPIIDQSGIKASIRSAYEDIRERATGAVKDTAKDTLHDAVEGIFEDSE